MSTVLWANVLVTGQVKSAQSGHVAPYQHAEKVDSITKAIGVTRFLSICDTTDARFNAGDSKLPDGVESTDGLTAVQGAWVRIPDASAMLETLRQHIVKNKVRFRLLSNQHQDVLDELAEVLAYARAEQLSAEKFNSSVVM